MEQENKHRHNTQSVQHRPNQFLRRKVDAARDGGNETPFLSPKRLNPSIQPKLTIGQPGDAYEQEADATADRVMRMMEGRVQAAPPTAGAQLTGNGALQRQCSTCGEEPTQRQAASETSEETPLVEEETVDKDETPDRQPLAAAGDELPPAASVLQRMPEETPAGVPEDVLSETPESAVQRMPEEEEEDAGEPVAEPTEDDIQRIPEDAEEDETEAGTEMSENPEPDVQRLPEEEEGAEPENAPLQRQAFPGDVPPVSAGFQQRLQQQQGQGQALPPDIQLQMGDALGADLGGVRVHTDDAAVQMSREINAQAFTHGADVYFNAGKYDPGTSAGKRLLAHELVHVGQQRGGNGMVGLQKNGQKDKSVNEQENESIWETEYEKHLVAMQQLGTQEEDGELRTAYYREFLLAKYSKENFLRGRGASTFNEENWLDFQELIELWSEDEEETIAELSYTGLTIEQILRHTWGFPKIWAERIEKWIVIDVDLFELENKTLEGYNKILSSIERLPYDIKENGFPSNLQSSLNLGTRYPNVLYPVDNNSKTLIYNSYAEDGTTREFANDAVDYIDECLSLEDLAKDYLIQKGIFVDLVRQGNLVVDYHDFQREFEAIDVPFLKNLYLLGYTSIEANEFTAYWSIVDFGILLNMAQGFNARPIGKITNIRLAFDGRNFNRLKNIRSKREQEIDFWNEFFQSKISNVNQIVEDLDSSERFYLALKWGYRRGFLKSAVIEIIDFIRENYKNMALYGGLTLLGLMIPGVNILVGGYLISTRAKYLVDKIEYLVNVIAKIKNAKTAVELQKGSAELSQALVGISIGMLLRLIPGGKVMKIAGKKNTSWEKVYSSNRVPYGLKNRNLGISSFGRRIGGASRSKAKVDTISNKYLIKELGLNSEQILNGSKIFGKKIGEIPELRNLWDNAFKSSKKAQEKMKTVFKLLNEGTDEAKKKAKQLAASAYERVRRGFWRRVVGGEEKQIFLDAGMKFSKTGGPYYARKDGTQDRLTIDHWSRKSEKPDLAVNADNLRFSPMDENSIFLEFIRNNDVFQKK